MSWEFGIHWFGGRKAKGSQATRNGQPPGQGGRTAPEEVNVVQATQQIVQARPSSISPSELAAQLDDLKNVLSLAMPKIKLEKDCRYLPEKALSAIVKRERLEEVLPNATGDLIEFILEKAKKLFVITINSIPPNHVTAAMEEFKLHRLYDTHLPIEDIGQICGAVPKRGVSPLCGVGINSSCNHEPAIDAFHHYPWTSVNRDAFCDFQWRLLVPKFTMEKLEKFETNRILPILQRSPKSVGGGHFSQVFMAKLLTDYQDHFSVKDDQITIAIKEMKNLEEPPDYNVETEWSREAEAMKEINKLQHPHITYGLAAFTQNQKYYLVLEWADGGNLRNFWVDNNKPQLTEAKVREFVCQLRGLSDALDKIHNSKKPSILRSRTTSAMPSPELSGTVSSSTVPEIQINGLHSSNAGMASDDAAVSESPNELLDIPTINVDSPTDLDKDTPSMSTIGDPNWRHGDLKPDNILVFKDSNSWIGTLKLADLGRAKKHQYGTHVRAMRRQNTEEKWSTRQYEPPEAYTASSKARSRLWDIWSMGCIMFESILWLLYGEKVKHSFATETTQQTPEGTIYYTPGDKSAGAKTATVNKLTTDCIAHMIKYDPECQPGTAIGDILVLIKEELLVVNLPVAGVNGPGCRANANLLLDRMNAIEKKAMTSSTYVFTGVDRTNVKVPPQASTSSMTAVTPKHGPTLVTPPHSESLPLPTKKKDTYSHAFRDVWEYARDDSYAGRILEEEEAALHDLVPKVGSRLCKFCQTLDFYSSTFKIKAKLSVLRARSQECDLCNLLVQSADRRGFSEAATLQFDRANSGLRLDGTGSPVLSICCTVEVPGLTGTDSYVRMGLPTLPNAGSPAQFLLLRHWLQDCDNNHGGDNSKCASQAKFILPTRLIDVGTDKDSPTVCLVKQDTLETRLKESRNKDLKYAAFSHPWGKVEDRHKHFVANRANIEKYSTEGISVGDLPNTFKDAVKISRGLGIQYLWIDSLCILQGPDGDFDEESKLMDAVFHSAYCVIAAASAVGTSSEVITRQPTPDPVVVPANKNGKKHSLFIREALEDFQEDVLDGPLSKRGWVLQERALARRTIFFTEKQVYWECADGIRCETLTKMKNSEVAFLGDSNFPTYALKSKQGERVSKGGQIFLYESLYEQYSTLDFSYPADRSVAILGLEQRLTRAFNDHGEHGIFKKHLERGLMWQRGRDGNGQEVKKLIRIKQKVADHDRGRLSPTWSWMAYEGGISFIAPTGGSLEWDERISWLTGDGKGNLRLKGVAREINLPDQNDTKIAEIIWDAGDRPENKTLKCVVFGTTKTKAETDVALKQHYVLMIAKVSAGGETLYERVGAGFLPGSSIKAQEEDVFIV